MNARAAWSVTVVGAISVMLGAGWASAGEEAVQLRDAPGRDLTTAFCAACHSLDYIEMNADVFDRTGWEKSVRKMIDRFGASISEEDAKKIGEYLAKYY